MSQYLVTSVLKPMLQSRTYEKEPPRPPRLFRRNAHQLSTPGAMPPATAAAGPGTGTAFTPVHPARAASARGRFYGSFPKTRFCFRELLGRMSVE